MNVRRRSLHNMKTLRILYYFFYCAALALVVVLGYIVDMQSVIMNPQSDAGQIVQYVVIAYILASVPGALYGFKRAMGKVSKIESEEERKKVYTQYAVIRMILIGVGILLGIFAFYLLDKYSSMLWCAGIAMIALYFCKPTEMKMYLEMNDKR